MYHTGLDAGDVVELHESVACLDRMELPVHRDDASVVLDFIAGLHEDSGKDGPDKRDHPLLIRQGAVEIEEDGLVSLT